MTKLFMLIEIPAEIETQVDVVANRGRYMIPIEPPGDIQSATKDRQPSEKRRFSLARGDEKLRPFPEYLI